MATSTLPSIVKQKSASRNRTDTRSRRITSAPFSSNDASRASEQKKKATRERQRRYRDRQRASTTRPSDEDISNTECFANRQRRSELNPTTSYISSHQSHALNDFLDRLRKIDTDLQICLTCRESYLGMTMSGFQCERCSKEVCITVFFSEFLVDVFSACRWSKRDGHRFVSENNADPGPLPEEVQETLQDLTQMEEMLCSLASPFFLMWVSKGGQYKTRGNVISFSQDLSELCTTLPRLPEDLDVLLVKKPNARDPSSYNDFRVRKDKVFKLLLFLKKHNPYYSSIEIRDPNDVDLPVDDSVLGRLPTVNGSGGCKDSTGQTGETAADSDDENEHYSPDELAEEQNSFVPNLLPDETELEAIRNGMRSNGLSDLPQNSVLWPSLGEPLSEYSTDGLFSKAFPALFPLGMADFSLPRAKRLVLHEWVKHLLRYHDPRFAIHPRFRFFALNLIFRHRAMGRGKFLFSRDVGNHNMTVAQLRAALHEKSGHILSSKIVRCLQTVRGTRPYWHMEGGKLRDMITQIGTPTLFYTLSMADLSWPDLHRLMPENPFAPGISNGESYRIRSRNLANNPHIVSVYLSIKHKHLRDTIFHHLDVTSEDRVMDVWYRVEWQARGSGALL
jgi:hypothetical protein